MEAEPPEVDLEAHLRDIAIHERVLAEMGDGVITLDLGGRIVTYNRAAAGILGIPIAMAVGRTYAELLILDSRFDALSDLVLRAIGDISTTHRDEIQLEVSGETRHYLANTSLLHTQDGGAKVGVIVVLRDVTARQKRRHLKRLFGEFMDPRIVERLLDSTASMEAGFREVMTVSFVDLAAFSAVAEQLDAQALVTFVNDYLSTMTQPITACDGVTDKYIGDAVMAFWGPPFTTAAQQAEQACAAALAQRRALLGLRSRSAVDLGDTAARLDIRCGIATGELVAGSVGPAQARRFTVLGDVVNLASRLEDANKVYGTRILVSETTARTAVATMLLRPVDRLRVRGRNRSELAFELMGHRAGAPRPLVELAERHGAAWAAYAEGRWAEALDGFEKCLESAPGDVPAGLLAGRCRQLGAAPPSPDWDGVWPPLPAALETA
jgi:adenylate cyclase